MMVAKLIRPGEEWGSPTDEPPDLDVEGSDATLAAAVATSTGALIRFVPDATSDFARAVGLGPRDASEPASRGTAIPVDILALSDGTLAANLCAIGTPPDRLRWSSRTIDLDVEIDGAPWFSGRATTVVIATGQFLRGLDVAPRGHPGDGKAEVQVYELARRERRPMRARLPTGSHVPHPRIRQRTARAVIVRTGSPARCEVDGVARPLVRELSIDLRPQAYRLLI
jgi:diacylglycerol kinase family enzyme